MARPKKEGLDYFPLDVDMDQDDKIALIEAKHGITGFGVILKLFMKIYKEGYFYKWEEKEQLLFSNRINVNINLVHGIVNDCINFGLFDKEIYEKYMILTSKGIQERYLEAILRRKTVIFIREYLLINIEDYRSQKIEISIINVNINGVNSNINHQSQEVNDNINPVNVGINPQSKVKESKVKNLNHIRQQIENLRLRYSEHQLKIIDDYLDMIRHTRVSAKISDSVIHKMYEEWDTHPEICVEYGLKTHLENVAYHSKKENYTFGIIRNTTAEVAASKLGSKAPVNIRGKVNVKEHESTDLLNKYEFGTRFG